MHKYFPHVVLILVLITAILTPLSTHSIYRAGYSAGATDAEREGLYDYTHSDVCK